MGGANVKRPATMGHPSGALAGSQASVAGVPFRGDSPEGAVRTDGCVTWSTRSAG